MTTVLSSYENWSSKDKTVVCLGNFDGMHLGHQEILRHCLREARSNALKSVAFTFWPHPRRFFHPESQDPKLIFSLDEKIEFLKQAGFDFIINQSFTESFSKIEAKDFAEEVLFKRLQADLVVVGRDFRFGYRARGNPDLLRQLGRFAVLEGKDERVHMGEREQTISSTLIRELIAKGEMEKVRKALGFFYFLSGVVGHGAARGAGLGVPTANLDATRECLPKIGVYTSMVEDLESGLYFPAATNLGFAPTFHKPSEAFGLKIEPHLLDFNGDLYGRRLRLYLLSRLRDEREFSSVELLKAQIHTDLQTTREYFADLNLLQSESAQRGLSLKSPAAESQSFEGLKFIQTLSM